MKLVRTYNSINECSTDVVGCVFDWFEVRVKGVPLSGELKKLGYSEALDKGCATHAHYFENDCYSIAWDIRSNYIAKTYSHFRVKNAVFYQLKGFNAVVEWTIQTCMRIFNCSKDEIIICRIDFAFDMPTGSFYHNILRSMFENRQFGVDKYTEFHGKVGSRCFTNFSAGSRSARLFFRLYYKTIENTNYVDNIPKKQYIADWHKRLFGNCDVVRFEVEYKPNGNHILTPLIYNQFQDLFDKYANGCEVKLQLAERYHSNEVSNEFSEKDRVQLVKLIRKFLASSWDSNYSFKDYIETVQEFTDILDNVIC